MRPKVDFVRVIGHVALRSRAWMPEDDRFITDAMASDGGRSSEKRSPTT